MKRFLSLLFCTLSVSSICLSQIFQISTEQLFNSSAYIIEGRVLDVESFWDEQHENIYTKHHIQVYKVLKSNDAQWQMPIISVVTMGGQVDLDLQITSEENHFFAGQLGLFALIPSSVRSSETLYECYAATQGFFSYNFHGQIFTNGFYSFSTPSDLYSAVSRVVGYDFKTIADLPFSHHNSSQRLPPSITSISITGSNTTAGTGDQITINGSGFGATQGAGNVLFKNANDGGATYINSNASDIISWGDNAIIVKVPSRSSDANLAPAGTGTIQVRDNAGAISTSPSTLTIDYAYTNLTDLTGARLLDINNAGGMTFTFNDAFCANKDAVNAFVRALKTWNCPSTGTGVNWKMSSSVSSITAIASDGTSIILFDNTSGASQLPAGVLGRATSRYSGCGTPAIWRVIEIDVAFDGETNWYYCDATSIGFSNYDFESVALHELGHGHQLNHVIDNTKTMHYAISNNSLRRTLSASCELAGGNYVLTQSTTACSRPAMTLLTDITCPLQTLPTTCTGDGSCTLSPLNVDIINFTGRLTDANQVLLNWTTASEVNNDFFTIEKSNNGRNYNLLGKIKGVGNSVINSQYELIDPNPFQGINYYRLSQTDFDGTTRQLGVVAVQYIKDIVINIFPNPADAVNTVTLDYNTIHSGNVIVEVLDVTGKNLLQVQFDALEGNNNFLLQIDGWANGVYVIKTTQSGNIRTSRFVKM